MVTRAAELNDTQMNPGPRLEGWARAAGFVNIRHKKIAIPVGPWAKDKRLKELGWLNLIQILGGLEAFSLRLLTQVLRWEPQEVEQLVSRVREEHMSKKMHVQFDL